MRILLIAALSVLCFPAASCTPLTRSVSSGPGRVAPPCVRQTVGFFQVPAEMARVQMTCQGVARCEGGGINHETKQIAGWINSNYLWGLGNTATSFDRVAQDGLLTAARARAVTQRPGSKTIISISFFTDIIVGPQPVYGYIGATAEYVDCVRANPQG